MPHEVHFTVHSERLLLPEVVGQRFAELIVADQDYPQVFDENDIRDWVSRERQQITPDGMVSSAWVLRYGFAEDAGIPDAVFIKTTSEFLKSVSDLPGVSQVLKYHDTAMHERARQYFEEVFEIEMDLRRVINYILLYNGRDDLEKTFKDFNAATVESYDKNRAKEYFENELYYVLFSVYGQFQQPRPLRDNEVIQLLTSVDDISLFFQNLRSRPLETERHRDFLSAIKQYLKPIEDLRNAVAHHRALSKTYESNYEKSRDNLRNAIQDFWIAEQDKGLHYRLRNGFFIWEEIVANEVRELLAGFSTDAATSSLSVPAMTTDSFSTLNDFWESLLNNISTEYQNTAPATDHEQRRDYEAFDVEGFVEHFLFEEYNEIMDWFRERLIESRQSPHSPQNPT